ISLLGLDRLSPRNQVLRDQVLALSYAEVCDSVRAMARDHTLAESAVEEVVKPYQAWIEAANVRDADERLTERDRLAIALTALANQERVLVLEARADRVASPTTVHLLLRNADALVEGARAEGRVGYRRAAEAALSFPSHSVSPIYSTDISGSCGFSPIAWPTVSSCCWSRGYWWTGSRASTTGGLAKCSASASASSRARSLSGVGNGWTMLWMRSVANTPTIWRPWKSVFCATRPCGK